VQTRKEMEHSGGKKAMWLFSPCMSCLMVASLHLPQYDSCVAIHKGDDWPLHLILQGIVIALATLQHSRVAQFYRVGHAYVSTKHLQTQCFLHTRRMMSFGFTTII
jgi:hypothetical protein